MAAPPHSVAAPAKTHCLGREGPWLTVVAARRVQLRSQSLAAAILHTTSKDFSCEHGPKTKTTLVDVGVPIGILGGPVECLRAVVARPPARAISVMGNRVQQTRRLGRQRQVVGEVVRCQSRYPVSGPIILEPGYLGPEAPNLVIYSIRKCKAANENQHRTRREGSKSTH